MPEEQGSLPPIVAAIFGLVLGSVIGLHCGTSQVRESAIRAGVARWNPQTRVFEWVGPGHGRESK